MPNSSPVVFVVDDDLAVREAIARLLRSVGLAVSCFGSTDEFLRRARTDAPACLVLDVRLPGTSGLELQTELAAREPELPIVFITGHGNIAMSVRAMKAGAVEFLPKPFRDEDLLDAINEALESSIAVRRARAEIGELETRLGSLSPRERQVFGLVATGMLNKQVAFELRISEATVKIHRRNVMQKMRAASVADLVRMAERLNNGAASQAGRH